MKRVGLGGLFFIWLYGVPFLLTVGLIRRAANPDTPTRAEAQEFGAVTDLLIQSGLVLNAVLPALGLLLAWLAGDRPWIRGFSRSWGWVLVVYLAVTIASSLAVGPLVGHVPQHNEPAPSVIHCVPRSGGHSCPGG